MKCGLRPQPVLVSRNPNFGGSKLLSRKPRCPAQEFHTGILPAQGLYNPAQEHESPGRDWINAANIRGKKATRLFATESRYYWNLAHRGACGCDAETGDGAAFLVQIPHQFYARECSKLGFELPQPGSYGVGMTFLPVEKHPRLQCEGIIERIVREEGLSVLGWRDMPVYASAIGRVARASQPYIQQVFIGRPPALDEDAFERKLYVVRKRAENETRESDDEDARAFLHSVSFLPHGCLQRPRPRFSAYKLL